MKSHDEIKKGLECLDKMQFFMGQRAGRELWNEKPHDVQERDLEQYNRDVDTVRALIQQLEAENSRYHQETTEMYAEMCMLREKVHRLEAERDAMKEALGLMVYQYCVSGTELDHRYMCAGETAFRVLGLEQYGDTRTLESWLFPEPPKEE